MVLGKAILSVTGTDVQHSAGAMQLCAGQEAGCEAAIHSLWTIFTDNGNEGALPVDASNQEYIRDKSAQPPIPSW